MLNPLLHTGSNSAPTSPICTRSVHAAAAPGAGVQFSISAGRHQVQTILASAVRQARPHMRSRDGSPDARMSIIPTPPPPPPPTQQQVYQVPLVIGPAPAQPQQQRRLSRLVKCRTLDFTEFPEGMREYQLCRVAVGPQMGHGPPPHKTAVRESQSQPGSPVPRIRIQDYGGGATTVVYGGGNLMGSEVKGIIKVFLDRTYS